MKGEKAKGPADAVTFHEAIQTAHDSEVDIDMDDNALNPHYGYIDHNASPEMIAAVKKKLKSAGITAGELRCGWAEQR